MAIVIADAGPLIALAKINQLELLPALFGAVTLTQAVADECLHSPTADALLIASALKAGYLHCVDNPIFQHPLSKSLGLGEQSSIEYALQANSKTLLLMDDALARKQALRLQLSVVGTAAVLFTAQRKSLIVSAETLIADLKKHGYRISDTVITQLKQSI